MATGSGAIFTTDFREEFEAETDRLLRPRFMWFSGLVGSLGVLGLIAGVALRLSVGREAGAPETFGNPWWWIIGAVWVGMYVSAFLAAWRGRIGGDSLVTLSLAVVAADGTLNVLLRAMGGETPYGVGGFMISHVLACLFLPWTPRQALRPVAVVLVVSAVLRLLVERPIWTLGGEALALELGLLLLTPLVAVPGMVVCWVRHSRRLSDFKLRFLQSRYGEVRRELVDARRLHESLFPPERHEGAVRLRFRYEPMRQIGGDFVFTREQAGRLSVVLADVTGHGIAAALTVNRLHGELERLHAERPDLEPGALLEAMNRYVHLTLAEHSLYLTMLAVRIDPEADELLYASGGHPPAFLRTLDGRVEELASTTFVLGACGPEEFSAEQAARPFAPGDTLIAYTDGASECRDEAGRMLGIDGIRRVLGDPRRVAAGAWSERLGAAIERHRSGPVADDTLLIEVYRPLSPRRGAVEPAHAKRSGERSQERAAAPPA